MFFNRVYDAALTDVTFDESGTENAYEIDDNALYRVVTGMYSAQMLGTVKSKSMGLLSLEPKQADGTPVTDFADCILYDANGNELKEWYALAAYLEQFGEDGLPDPLRRPRQRLQAGVRQLRTGTAFGRLERDHVGGVGDRTADFGLDPPVDSLPAPPIRRKKPTPVN